MLTCLPCNKILFFLSWHYLVYIVHLCNEEDCHLMHPPAKPTSQILEIHESTTVTLHYDKESFVQCCTVLYSPV